VSGGNIMGKNNVVFLEVIEWFDQTGNTMLARIPASGSGEIKYGAQLIVRESQAGVFFYNGRAIHVFGPGRHTLQTANIPILNKIMSVPWGLTSPLRAEVYIVNLKTFTQQKWGTRDPVAFKDSQMGLIRLRAHGLYTVRIIQPLLFINTLTGTVGDFSTQDVDEYLSSVIVSRFNDYLGENLDSMLDLPGKYDEISGGLKKCLHQDFAGFGLELSGLYINSITPPLDVQKAIDDRSKLGIFDDLNNLMKLKSAMAMEKAAENAGSAADGMGIGFGMMLPAMLSRQFPEPVGSAPRTQKCPGCGRANAEQAQFCMFCGHHLILFSKCTNCGENLDPLANYCSRCGKAVAGADQKKRCSHCNFENLGNATFCNQCGERL
jgi:membrane protease subunit (stomatin/prohibitin family)